MRGGEGVEEARQKNSRRGRPDRNGAIESGYDPNGDNCGWRRPFTSPSSSSFPPPPPHPPLLLRLLLLPKLNKSIKQESKSVIFVCLFVCLFFSGFVNATASFAYESLIGCWFSGRPQELNPLSKNNKKKKYQNKSKLLTGW